MSAIDPQAFRDFEHQGWEAVASRYHDGFAAVTQQAVSALLDAAHVAAGRRVLDLACGPGYVAAAAAARGAEAVGVDFSAVMIEEARRRYPAARFEEGDAEKLAYAPESFDSVLLNFGMLHLGRPEQALGEVHRVLRPGGRIAFTVWDLPERAVGFGIVIAAIRRHGDLNVPIPPGPPFFRFSDEAESRGALSAAGFTAAASAQIPQIWRLRSSAELFDVMYEGSVRNAAVLRAQTPDALAAIRDEMRSEVEKRDNTLPMPAVLFSAVK